MTGGMDDHGNCFTTSLAVAGFFMHTPDVLVSPLSQLAGIQKTDISARFLALWPRPTHPLTWSVCMHRHPTCRMSLAFLIHQKDWSAPGFLQLAGISQQKYSWSRAV